MSETYKFEAEINQLMNIIINSFYSDKDVFLRELISNSSDALDKIRYLSLTDLDEVLGKEKDLKIYITPNKDDNTLTIYDNGIGMTKKDLISNLGTMARSGTKAFVESLKNNENNNVMNLIGQFGVGFYSVFLVGEKVKVITKNNNDDTYVWESDGSENFQVSKYEENNELYRGTKIIIYLKKDQEKYLDSDKLKKIIEKHSSYIKFPIYLHCQKTKEEENEEENKEEKTENNNTLKPKVEDVKENKKEKKTVTYYEYENINSSKPIWTLNPKEIPEKDYEDFYKSFTGDYQEYLIKTHFKAEGTTEFTGLFFVPKTAPFDLFQNKKKSKNIKLFVKRVLITDDCSDMLPDYLTFLRGLVDSDDLPLNVSREMLQQDSTVKMIKKQIVKKCIDMIYDLSLENDEKYKNFYEQYSKNIKLGVHNDSKNRDKLVKLIRFNTCKHKDSQISFEQYVKEMPSEQNEIYYLCGETIKSIEDSPFLEYLKRKNYDVILFVDSLDEYFLQQLKDYNEKKLVDVSKENTNFKDTNKEKEMEEKNKEYDNLLKYVKEVLGDKIDKVSLSDRIVNFPCALSSSQYGMSANMERIIKAQALSNNNMHMMMMSKKNMEINPEHELIKKLKSIYDVKNLNLSKILIQILYESSLISSGYNIEKPSEYAIRLYTMLLYNFSSNEFLEQKENMKETVEEQKELKDEKKVDESNLVNEIKEQGIKVVQNEKELDELVNKMNEEMQNEKQFEEMQNEKELNELVNEKQFEEMQNEDQLKVEEM